jgi:hypothetical protein
MGNTHKRPALFGSRVKAIKTGLRGSLGADRAVSFVCSLDAQTSNGAADHHTIEKPVNPNFAQALVDKCNSDVTPIRRSMMCD